MKKNSKTIKLFFKYFFLVILFFGLLRPVYAEITAEEIACNKNGGTCQFMDCDPKTQIPKGECKYSHCCAPNAALSTPKWEWVLPELQIQIPGLPKKFLAPTNCQKDEKDNPTNCEITWINQYVAGIYNYAIGIVGILAAVVLMFGGLLWLTAGGNATRVGEAKAWIGASLTGLVIALTSYMILYQINPGLVIPQKGVELDFVKEFIIPPSLLNYDGFTAGDGSQIPPGTSYNANTWDNLINQIASRLNMDPALIKSVMATESAGNPNAHNPSGAAGLMQLMPRTAQELGVTNVYDPVQNLTGGSRYLNSLLKRYNGDMPKALAAYNWGPGNVERRGLNNMPQETRNYINKVTTYYSRFRR